mmetsp:Transcript_39734/g.123342  ORF Transcript_39734/g.123342 Transcript_39734/m.123342 type:complete len:923 (+) Transcript_39734:98-2866(+)
MGEEPRASSGDLPVAKKPEATSDTDTLVASLARRVTSHPVRVLVPLAALLGLAAWWAHELHKQKGMAAVVPRSSNSVLSDFPDSTETIRDVMVFWCKACDLPSLQDFTVERKAVQGLLDTMRARNRHCSDLGWSSLDSNAAAGYGLVNGLQFSYLSTDRTTSFVEYHATRRECMRDVRRKLQTGFRRSSGMMLMSLGGPESVAGASMDAELRSMTKHAYVAVPLSCILLWLFVGNVFRVLTPVVCMIAAYLSGQATVGIVKTFAPGLNVNYDDSFVLFIDLALCVDYALFLWTRFAFERARHEYKEAVRLSLQTSGTVILVSNFFVVVAWTCTLSFPGLNLWGFQALYVEALSGCAFAGLWSLTFTPSMAVAFPQLFDNGDSLCSKLHQGIWELCPEPQSFWKPWAKRITSKPLMLVLPLLAYACMVPFIATLSRYQPSYDIQRQGSRRDTLEHEALEQFEHHFRVGLLSPITLVVEADEVKQPRSQAKASSWPSPVLGAVSTSGAGRDPEVAEVPEALVPELLSLSNTRTASADVASLLQHGLMATTPHHATQQPHWRRLLREASPGIMKAAGAAIRKLALNPDFGDIVCKVAEAIMNKTRGRQYEIQMADMLSIWWLPPESGKSGCSVGTAKMVLRRGISLESGVLGRLPPVLQKSISKDGKKVQLKLFTRFSPSSPQAVALDHLLRSQFESQLESGTNMLSIGGRDYKVKVHHTSAVARQVEANKEMARAAPKIFGIFVALIAVLITATFRSAFLSVKLALTVLLPIVSTYGVAVAIYQLNVLGGLGSEILSGTDGLDFRMVYVTPGVLFGLAMDYDLFLFARVYELRLEGYDNISAVRRALAETGPVITAAGVLMAISFFAIMLSNTMLFRTLGFVFFFGVTFDVFVVRTCIAPVFLCLAERLNYWPAVMPKASKSWP